MEDVGDTGLGNFGAFRIFGSDGAIFEGGVEKVDYGKGEAFLRGRLGGNVSM